MTTVLKLNTSDLDFAFVDDLKAQFGHARIEVRIDEMPDAAGQFSEADFWDSISLLDWTDDENNARVVEPLVDALAKRSIAQIYQFQDRLSEKLWQLDTARHAKPLRDSDPEQFLSSDEFLYARCCVVANGREFFEKILNDPTAFPTELTFESLLYVASAAFERKTGKKFIAAPAFNFETGSNKAAWPQND